MRLSAALFVPLVAGCLWVTNDEVEQSWDKDADGWGFDLDCNDANATVHPFAPDWRGDDCDADCGSEPDADGDDWPDDNDCAPNDAAIYPCSATANGDVDVDCDGLPGVSRPATDCDSARRDPDFPTSTEPVASCAAIPADV